jgi:ubiquinone/menaquinone biosynthesis C-methylase UbiE
MFSSATTIGSGRMQGLLWGRNARDWFDFQETQCKALYQVLLKALSLNRDSAVLDAGCGSGMFCEMASEKGASVMGLDASNALLDLARRRAPRASFFEGEMESLPFVDGTFDVVTLLNSLHHTSMPLKTLKEARRVLRPSGRVAIAAWSRPEECKIAEYFRLLDELLPVDSPNTPVAFSYSEEGALNKAVSRAGFFKLIEARAITIWNYPDENAALRGLLSTSSAAQAAACAGEARVIEATRKFLQPFRLPRGGIRLENSFRYIIAQRG